MKTILSYFYISCFFVIFPFDFKMDNKKTYKKIATFFWFMLATLPLWVALIRYVFMWFIHTDALSNVEDIKSLINLNQIQNAFDTAKTYFYGGMPSFIRTMYEQLLLSFGMSVGSSLPSWLSVFMAWFTWVYFVELMVDFIVWFPRWCHKLFDKVGD